MDLEIDDGVPWWLSPDIWTVPGSDPFGAVGAPRDNETCFVWARIHNRGSVQIANAPVGFYWAPPNVGWDRSQANAIGTSFVTVDGSSESEVLCLTPWLPTWAYGPHVCLLVEVGMPGQLLPHTGSFDVIANPQTAQHNVNIVDAHMNMFHFSFDVRNAQRQARRVTLRAEADESFDVPDYLRSAVGKRAKGELRSAGLIASRCPESDLITNAEARELEIDVAGFGCSGATIAGVVGKGVTAIHVREYADDQEIGGLTVIVKNDGKGR